MNEVSIEAGSGYRSTTAEMASVLWRGVIPYREGAARVERLPSGWRLTLGAETVERRTLVEAFEEILGRTAGSDEVGVVLTALASAHVMAPADAALTRELHSLDLEQDDVP